MKVTPELYEVELADTTIYSCKSAAEFENKLLPYRKLSYIQFKEGEQYEEGKHYYYPFAQTKYVLSAPQVIELTLKKIPFTVQREVKVDVDITKQLIDLAERPIKLTQEGGGNTYNTRCEVHMPGQALSLYNEVQLLEDCCTDQLQSSLASGWRIIAACPQPDQRRPDYILGRYNPKIEKCDSADRGAN